MKIIHLTENTCNNVELGASITRDMIHTIVDYDCDIYKPDGKLLVRFRKNLLNDSYADLFKDNVIKFAKGTTKNRGVASGSIKKSMKFNKPTMTNIFGYFDSISPAQKLKLKKQGKVLPLQARICRFNRDFPDKYSNTLPFINDINNIYKILLPDKFATQNALAQSTLFKIDNTAFTTVTTNVNFTTSVHLDKGDYVDGFGNLAVIDSGSYSGAETCFPEYGIGINVRKNDILFMDVHTPHGNLPMVDCSAGATRLSVVCYLRTRLVERTAGMSQDEMDELINYL